MLETITCSSCGTTEQIFVDKDRRDAIEDIGWIIKNGLVICLECSFYADQIDEELNGRSV